MGHNGNCGDVHVRFGSKAEVNTRHLAVRFTPENGPRAPVFVASLVTGMK
jgi:hypothetical protein